MVAVQWKREQTASGVSRARADKEAVAELLARPDDDPADLEALDDVWEESEVRFGPDPNAGCPQVRDMLANMDTPINPDPRHAVAGFIRKIA